VRSGFDDGVSKLLERERKKEDWTPVMFLVCFI
jgi:hypothetical protein